jgi:polar amino acid transport system permease protein
MALDFSYVLRNLPTFLDGLIVTIELALLAILCSLSWGLVIVLLRTARARPLRWLAAAYIEVVRDTPLLVQMLFIYFGFSMAGLNLSGFASALLAISLQHGGYMAEIYRGGLESISVKQTESGKALGMSRWQVLSIVIWPQAIGKIVPPLGNQCIFITKDTSLASVIAVAEITQLSKMLSERSAAVYEIFFTVSIFYLLLTSAIVLLTRLAERRVAVLQ